MPMDNPRTTHVKDYYAKRDTVRDYDKKRFTGRGGRYIDYTEQKIISDLIDALPTTIRSAKRLEKRPLVLDLASGSGRFAILLAKKGCKVVAFDYSQEMLNLIGEKCRREGLNVGEDIILVQGDANRFPFKPETFDAAVSMRFMWHYKKYPIFIDNVMKVLKKNGYFVFDLFNLYSLRALYTLPANLSVYVNLATRKKFYEFAEKRSYKIEAEKAHFFFPYLFYRFCPDFLAGIMIWTEEKIQKSALYIFSSVIYFKLRK